MENKPKDSEKKKVQMTLTRGTILKVEALAAMGKGKSGARVVAEAVAVLHTLRLLTTVGQGANIVVEYPNGAREELVLP